MLCETQVVLGGVQVHLGGYRRDWVIKQNLKTLQNEVYV